MHHQWTFMPHGACVAWDPFIIWGKALSDAVIAAAYVMIAIGLILILRNGIELGAGQRAVLQLVFAAFIASCAMTHVMDVFTIWRPWYELDTVVRMLTAGSSLAAAMVLWSYLDPNGA